MRYFIVIAMAAILYGGDDMALVNLAYQNGLKPVPGNFDSLLLTLNTDVKDLSKEKLALGRKLFFDKELSLGRDISCASCHSFNKGGADGIPTAIGYKNQKNPFHLNSPTVLNTAFSKKLFWNGRSDTLQDQAKGPLQAPFEMSITPALAEERIKSKAEYQNLFEKVYDNQSVTFQNITDAIATYEKTLVTRGRFDDFLLGNFNALDEQEKEGLKLFISKGCVGCHNGIGLGGQVLRKFPLAYHEIWSMEKPIKIKALQEKYRSFVESLKNIVTKDETERIYYMKSKIDEKDLKLLKEGFFSHVDKNDALRVMTTSACTKCHENDVYQIRDEIVKNISFPFENEGGFLGAENPKKHFRVPLLRNVVKTAPYFHNGSVEKLEDAVKIMGTHQSRITLSDDEIKNIVSFLKAVDGEIVAY